MPRVLLVKTSSLGDVVHNLPVVCDLVAALPGVTIDWVVEEGFAAIPRLHPQVSRVLPFLVRARVFPDAQADPNQLYRPSATTCDRR